MSPLMLDHSGSYRTNTMQTRAFVTVPAKVQDIRRFVDIEFSAFENEQSNQVLSFRDYKKPAHFERTVEIYRDAMNVEVAPVSRAAPPQIKFKKVVDTDCGETVSFAKIETKAYTLDELHSPLDSGHEHEPRMNRDWFALNERLRREYVGLKEHCYIGMLATAPQHQHQGAGTMLLGEILSEADEAGVEVYLEATDTAKPLYEKHGFKAITELRFDPAQYGYKGLGIERQTVMVRGALEKQGDRAPVRSWEAAVTRSKLQLQDA